MTIPPPAGGADVTTLERACRGAQLLGLELDTRYRVLAATLDPDPAVLPWELTGDRRLQLLCSPVSTILGTLRRQTDEGAEVITFEVEQLVDVSAGFGGCVLEPPVFGRPQPRPGQRGPFSLQGRSTAPTGHAQTATFAVEDDEARLEIFVRFDDVEVRDATGKAVDA